MKRSSVVAVGLVTAFLMACSSGEKPADTTSASPGATPTPSAGGTSTPASGGTTHVVEMITDGTGNYFKPNTLNVKRGDVVRYTLTAGVHNVDFFPDSNPKWKGAPLVSDMLQLPGQTFDVPVNFAPGKYYFHCDPHAALGMIGHLTVAE